MANRNQRVRVTRAYYAGGKVRGAGTVYTEDFATAVELRGAGKCEFVQADEKAVENTAPTPPRVAAKPDDKGDGEAAKPKTGSAK